MVLRQLSIYFLCLFIFEREADRTGVGEGQREKETESKAGSGFHQAVSTEPDAGLEPTNCEMVT